MTKMMKVLFYNHTATVSGAERVLLLILSQLDRRKFTLEVWCPSGSLSRMVEELRVPCREAEPLAARFTWRPDHLADYLRSFYRVIRQVRARVIEAAPDLIHANSIRAGLVMTAATAGLRIPVIWHLHDLLPRHPFSSAIRAVALSSSRLRLIAVSQATADRFNGWLSRLFSQRVPVSVIHNAAQTEKFQFNPASRKAVRAELDLADTQPVIGIVGQLTERKGQLGLLRAFAKVTKIIPQAVLFVVGAPLFTQADQDYHQHLLQTAERLGLTNQVRFLGERSDIPAVMQALDVLVVNSLAEPCGLVVLEGMASGTPIIATAVGGNPEMIRHNENGWLVPARDETALAQAIIKLIRQPPLAARFAENARDSVLTDFTVTSFMNKLNDSYLAAISRAPVTIDSRQAVIRPNQYPAD